MKRVGERGHGRVLEVRATVDEQGDELGLVERVDDEGEGDDDADHHEEHR